MWTMLATAIPQADPLPMPGPPPLLHGLLLLTFLLHLLSMNFVLGGSIIATFARMRGTESSLALARWLAKLMPVMVAATITFGVAPLLFLQALYGRLFFSSSVLIAWSWLAVVPAVMLAYYGTYTISFGEAKLGRAAAAISMAVALVFVGIAWIYSNNMTLMIRPEVFPAMYAASAGGGHLNTSDATLLPRYLHMLFGALALAGIAVAVYGAARRDEGGAWALRNGSLTFTAATILNFLTGIWWLGALPAGIVAKFMGKEPLATVALAVGIVAALAAMIWIVGASAASDPRRIVHFAAAALLVSIGAMIVARDRVRTAALDAAGYEPSSWVDPQWGVIAAFLLLVVGAVAVTVWMAMLLRQRPAPKERA